MEILALGATLIFALIVAAGWTFYRLDTAGVRPDWRRIGMLVFGHVALVAAIVTLFVAPTALPIILGGTLVWGMTLAFYVFGRTS
jgi:hypothetical protein